MYKILIVDDEKKSRDYLSDLIVSVLPGSIITQAANPSTALELLKKNDYDLLFSDIVMPQIDGLEMIQRIEQLGKKPFIILVSAHDKFEYAQKGMELGASGYILKPYSKDHINKIIGNYLDKTDKINEMQKTILLGKGDGRLLVEVKDIVAVERVDRSRVNVYTQTKQIPYVNGVLSGIMDHLPDHFLRINRQCIINLKAVKRFSLKSRKVFLSHDQKEIPFVCSRGNINVISTLLIQKN